MCFVREKAAPAKFSLMKDPLQIQREIYSPGKNIEFPERGSRLKGNNARIFGPSCARKPK